MCLHTAESLAALRGCLTILMRLIRLELALRRVSERPVISMPRTTMISISRNSVS